METESHKDYCTFAGKTYAETFGQPSNCLCPPEDERTTASERRVLKWPVPVSADTCMIGAGRVLLVEADPHDPALVFVWTEERLFEGRARTTRRVGVFGTGHPLPKMPIHVGSARTQGGEFVWHIYEITE